MWNVECRMGKLVGGGNELFGEAPDFFIGVFVTWIFANAEHASEDADDVAVNDRTRLSA